MRGCAVRKLLVYARGAVLWRVAKRFDFSSALATLKHVTARAWL
ncbi:hypothetical protein HMPREF9244_00695 [Alloscardovia omnicolens F0580]|uniref:Uncharacterized protein n=1 Tax=Alloscardovia omnicolens F0580 TaxID=1321816 RepID=U1SGE0_9BIFI|nr:hypothetical protein HMPREF9244_00695 [Alloscardovia omnicolens F0580]